MSGAVQIAEWEVDPVFHVTFLPELYNDCRTGLSKNILQELWDWLQQGIMLMTCGYFLGPYHPDAPLKEPLSTIIKPRLEEEGET